MKASIKLEKIIDSSLDSRFKCNNRMADRQIDTHMLIKKKNLEMNLQHIPPILLSTLISTLIRLVESERGTRNPITLPMSARSASFFSSSPLSSSSSHWFPALPPRPSSICFYVFVISYVDDNGGHPHQQ